MQTLQRQDGSEVELTDEEAAKWVKMGLGTKKVVSIPIETIHYPKVNKKMITVYMSDTGKEKQVDEVDARDYVRAGLASYDKPVVEGPQNETQQMDEEAPSLTAAQLREVLTAGDVKFGSQASKPELLAMYVEFLKSSS